MANYLVCVDHGISGEKKVPARVVKKSIKLVRGLPAGATICVESPAIEIELLTFIGQALRHGSLEKVRSFVLGLKPETRTIEYFQMEFKRQPQAIYRKMRTEFDYLLWPRLFAAAKEHGVKVVSLESEAAAKYLQAWEEQMAAIRRRYGRNAMVELTPDFLKYPYARGALREKGFLTRMRRHNPALTFVGYEHGANFRLFNLPELEKLGISPKRIIEIRGFRLPLPSRAHRQNRRLELLSRTVHGRGVRRLPRSFRKA